MLQRVKNLPPGIDGVEAIEKVTRDDYETVLKPMVEEAHRNQRPIRFLYHFGAKFEAFTPGAVWEDLNLGLKYIRLFEGCAVVTDRDWIRHSCQLMAALIPCPLRVFKETEWANAVEWLGSLSQPRHLIPRLIPEKEVLVVEVKGPLSKEDFNVISAEVDPWIEKHHTLRGFVVHAERFPGWEDLGSFFRHVDFVGEHHRKVHRVALAADGVWSEFMPKLANHFVDAELKHFTYADLERAVEWASEAKKKSPA